MQGGRVRQIGKIAQPGLHVVHRGVAAHVPIRKQMPHQAAVIQALGFTDRGGDVAPRLRLEGTAHPAGIGGAHGLRKTGADWRGRVGSGPCRGRRGLILGPLGGGRNMPGAETN